MNMYRKTNKNEWMKTKRTNSWKWVKMAKERMIHFEISWCSKTPPWFSLSSPLLPAPFSNKIAHTLRPTVLGISCLSRISNWVGRRGPNVKPPPKKKRGAQPPQHLDPRVVDGFFRMLNSWSFFVGKFSRDGKPKPCHEKNPWFRPTWRERSPLSMVVATWQS